MNACWNLPGDALLRIVREQGNDPPLWHLLVDDPERELEVALCGLSAAWVDLADPGALGRLDDLCAYCAIGLGHIVRVTP